MRSDLSWSMLHRILVQVTWHGRKFARHPDTRNSSRSFHIVTLDDHGNRKKWECGETARVEGRIFGRKGKICGGRRVGFWRSENVFELVSRAVSRKRRGVSRRWPNITQRSLFRARGEVGARNRNDLEHTGPPCSIVALSCGRHFHCTTGSSTASLWSNMDVARRTARFYVAGRSTSREVLPPSFHLFSRRPEKPGSCLATWCTWKPRAVTPTTFHFLFVMQKSISPNLLGACVWGKVLLIVRLDRKEENRVARESVRAFGDTFLRTCNGIWLTS